METRGGSHGKPLSQNPKAIRQRAYRDRNRDKVRATAREWYSKNPEKGYPGGWAQRLLITAKSNSKKYQRQVLIDTAFLNALWEKQQGRCHWSGIPMEKLRNTPWVVSLDRLDNSRGYEPGNVALCAWVINRARGNLPEEDFLDVLTTLAFALSDWRAPNKRVA